MLLCWWWFSPPSQRLPCIVTSPDDRWVEISNCLVLRDYSKCFPGYIIIHSFTHTRTHTHTRSCINAQLTHEKPNCLETHTHTLTLTHMAIWSNLGFSILSKDTLTCRPVEPKLKLASHLSSNSYLYFSFAFKFLAAI